MRHREEGRECVTGRGRECITGRERMRRREGECVTGREGVRHREGGRDCVTGEGGRQCVTGREGGSDGVIPPDEGKHVKGKCCCHLVRTSVSAGGPADGTAPTGD